jgi:hypothetical protein
VIILSHGYTIFFTVEAAGVATAADSTPTATLYRNGTASGVTVTVATTAVTGLYKATFTTDAGWAKTDVLHLTVAAAIASTSGYVAVVWDSTGDVDAVMRGTDSAATPANVTTSTSTITALLPDALVGGRMDVSVGAMAADTVTASALAADAVEEIQAGLAQTGADGDTLETLSDQIDGLGGSGTGARTITVTIDDGTDPLENAIVRMTEGVNTYTALSDVTGVATFNLDDATYVVAITKSGYSYAGTTLLVDGDETETYSLTQVTPTIPDDPALCAVTIHVRDQYGVDLPDEPVEITFVSWAVGAADTVPVLSPPPVQTTDVDGTVAVNLYRNAVYKIIYGSADYALRANVTVPDAGTYEVTI